MSKVRTNDVLSSNNNEIISDDDEILSTKSGALDSSGENDEIFMIHSEGKEVKLTEEINIEVEPKPMFCMDNYKDALLASLSSQLDFLKNELEEKNLLIRTLIRESDVYNHSTSTHSDSNMEGNDESDGSSVDNKSNRESVSENTGDEFYDDDDSATDEYFNDLYVQYE